MLILRTVNPTRMREVKPTIEQQLTGNPEVSHHRSPNPIAEKAGNKWNVLTAALPPA